MPESVSDEMRHNFTGRRQDGFYPGLDTECSICGIPRRNHPRATRDIPFTVLPPADGTVTLKLDGRFYDLSMEVAARMATELLRAVTEDTNEPDEG